MDLYVCICRVAHPDQSGLHGPLWQFKYADPSCMLTVIHHDPHSFRRSRHYDIPAFIVPKEPNLLKACIHQAWVQTLSLDVLIWGEAGRTEEERGGRGEEERKEEKRGEGRKKISFPLPNWNMHLERHLDDLPSRNRECGAIERVNDFYSHFTCI